MKQIIFMVFMGLVLAACGRSGDEAGATMTFDTIKWDARKNGDYLYRKYMLKDVMTQYQWTGRPREDVRALLGPPDSGDSTVYVYRIEQKRLNFFPLHTRALIFKMDSTGHVKAVKIFE